MTAEIAQKANPASRGRGRGIRRWLGAGAYPFLSKWLDPSRQFSQIAYAQLLSKLVPSGAAWLDAGCGHQVFKISSAQEEAQIVSRTNLAVGCDLDWQGLRAHRSLKLRVCCDLRRMPFESETFDVVTLNYVAEHLEDSQATFAELSRILRPGGILIVVTPHALGYFVRLSNVGRKVLPESLVRKFIRLREFRSSEDIFPTFYRANTREDLLRQMNEAGLTEECFQMLRDPAIFNFIAPLAATELLAIRLLALLGFSKLAEGTMIGVYRRSPTSVACPRQTVELSVRATGSRQVGLP
jgi:ubiquinone/menaquinone biosynthesis C-methylase UbiE